MFPLPSANITASLLLLRRSACTAATPGSQFSSPRLFTPRACLQRKRLLPCTRGVVPYLPPRIAIPSIRTASHTYRTPVCAVRCIYMRIFERRRFPAVSESTSNARGPRRDS